MLKKNVVIVGVGGVGGYIGGRIGRAQLQFADNPYSLTFVARGAHLTAIKKHGLTVITPDNAPFNCRPDLVTARIHEIPTPDMCFICVKSYDLEPVCRELADILLPETFVVPLLNGVDIHERIRRIITRGMVLPGCIYIGTHIEQPGTIRISGGEGRIVLGPDPVAPEIVPYDLCKLLEFARLPYRWLADPTPAIWEKFLFIAAFGLVTAYTQKNLGQIATDAVHMNTVQDVMEEIRQLAESSGIQLPADIVRESLEKARQFSPETKTSYQRDVESRGQRNEGDVLGGTILRLGKKLGLETPIAETLYNGIQTRLQLFGK